MRTTDYCVALLSVFLSTSLFAIQEQLDYPQTRRVDVVDEIFGIKVPDPYRWLETDVRESEEVAKWVEQENLVTFAYLKKLPYRDQIEKRLTKLWNFEKYSPPMKAGDRYYFSKNDGLQNQSVVYRQANLDAEPQALIDPNEWSTEGVAALTGLEFTENDKYVAFGRADKGSDWQVWRVLEIETGKILDDEIHWIKFGSVQWSHDETGFYYSRFPQVQEGEEFQSLNFNQKVYYHKLGDPQDADTLVLETPDEPKWGFTCNVTEDGKFLVVTIHIGTAEKYRIKYKRLDQPHSEFVDLIDNFDHEYSFVGNEGDALYFLTDWKAPRKSVIAINVNHPDPANWKTIIPEAAETLQNATMVGDSLLANYLQDAKTLVKQFGLDGSFTREIKLPGIGSAGGFSGRRNHDETFYSFSSFNTPPRTYRYDLETGVSTLLRAAKVDFNPDDFQVEQVFYKSKDDTQVPMFICHKTGIKLDGTNPTLLYGYGGFAIPLTPVFSISRLQWMEMGGVFAMPNLRGGGEYGEEWHLAGTKTHKQNVFDDFIAAAQWLIDHHYTSTPHLAIQGASNGGLLVGACMTQRPDLFGACLPAVGVMDMLRFQKFTAGRYWTDDYGSADESEEEFKALLAYSPYHNLRNGTAYPPTLVTTADTDDRVVPGHSFKFAARLQASQAGDAPVLIRIETKAGHGAGKPTSKQIEEIADQWAFLAKHLGLQPYFPN